MTCQFSPDRKYRYMLWRHRPQMHFGDSGDGVAMWIGLNPSTADETKDDPTIRRCINFTHDWGFTHYCMTNLFAFRATDPRVMMAEPEPVGIDNDKWLLEMAPRANIIVCAWGNGGAHMGRDAAVAKLLQPFRDKLRCLKLTQAGAPWHPLYVSGNTQPMIYQPI